MNLEEQADEARTAFFHRFSESPFYDQARVHFFLRWLMRKVHGWTYVQWLEHGPW
jgi:hypothetical protein